MADDRFVSDTFHGGPTGPQPDERWTQPIDPSAVRIHMEVVMSDDTTTQDHAAAIHEALERYDNHEAELIDTAVVIEQHAAALAARVARLQRLWQAWQRAGGGQPRSHAYAAFLDALKACEDAGDLLPVED